MLLSVPTECTDTITIDYTLQSDQRTWVHTVSKNGAVISTLQTCERFAFSPIPISPQKDTA